LDGQFDRHHNEGAMRWHGDGWLRLIKPPTLIPLPLLPLLNSVMLEASYKLGATAIAENETKQRMVAPKPNSLSERDRD
jgi:hypothetical protein